MSQKPHPGASAWARKPSRPWVLGHRGARLLEPENTLRAFERALADGADGVELDVRMTADGEVVVLHDPTLTRMTDGRDGRPVADLSLREIGAIELIGGARAPTLAETLAWARDKRARLNIEVKQDVSHLASLVREVIHLVRTEEAAEERILLSSFHPGVVRELARRLPRCAVGWLVHGGQFLLRTAPWSRWLGATVVHPELTLVSDARLERWQNRGALVAVWTVNDPEAACRLNEQGVDILISDDPGTLIRALPGRGLRVPSP